jgi:4'-phosphopantetheinyl transferase
VIAPPAGREVHVWTATRRSAAQDSQPDILSEDERERAARFLVAAPRDRFVAGRLLARAVLGRYLRTSPAAIAFAYSAAGKPGLGGSHQGCGLHFSLSHAGDIVTLAVRHGGPLGIDVEETRPGRFLPALISRVFTASERQAIAASTDPERACYRLWVRKEACVKASGEGIAAGLSSLDVLDDRCLDSRGSALGIPRWSVADLPMPEGYVAAIAAECDRLAPLIRAWPHE